MINEELLALFACTEVYIFVFIELITRTKMFRRVIVKRATRRDTLIFIVVFGAFSIFGTYAGIPLPSGAIVNIRDLSPMVAGLVAGPLVGLGVGLVGGIHRFLLGGFTCLPCGLATILAGFLGGVVFRLNKGKLVNVPRGILLVILVEGIHAGLTMLLSHPFSEALVVVKTAIPAMVVANSLGIAICIVSIDNRLESADRWKLD